MTAKRKRQARGPSGEAMRTEEARRIVLNFYEDKTGPWLLTLPTRRFVRTLVHAGRINAEDAEIVEALLTLRERSPKGERP